MSAPILSAGEFGFHAQVRLDRAEIALCGLLRQMTLDREYSLSDAQMDQFERIQSLVIDLTEEVLLRHAEHVPAQAAE